MAAEEHHLAVPRAARYVTLGSNHTGPKEVWFVCHGYGQLADQFIREFEALDDGSRLIVAPEALSRFYLEGTGGAVGASWMTKIDRLREIDDYTVYLDALYTHVFERVDRDGVRVVVLGFSQGGATAARWVSHGSGHADHLVLWAALVPDELQSREGFRRLRALELTLVYGRTDADLKPFLAEQSTHLDAHGITPQELRFDGGHRMDRNTLATVAAHTKQTRTAT
jgi:predicted esterase